MQSEHELLAEILAQGDLDRLITLTYPKIKSYFVRRVYSVDDCLDLTQETLLRVCRGIEGYRGGPEKFWGWLFRIASNLLHDWRKGRGAAPEDPMDDLRSLAETLPTSSPSPEVRALQEERKRALAEAVEELPPQMRRCTLLRLGRGLRYREIAELLGLSEGAVKAHLNQARKRLEEALRRLFEALEDSGTKDDSREDDDE